MLKPLLMSSARGMLLKSETSVSSKTIRDDRKNTKNSAGLPLTCNG
jgi:hypothetical protein